MKSVLASLPWAQADILSVQLGSISSFLTDKGLSVTTRHYYRDVLGYLPRPVYRLIQDTVVGEFVFAAMRFPQCASDIERDLHRRCTGRLDLGRTLEQLDCFLDDAVDDLLSLEPEIVGLSTTHLQLMASLCLAKRLKQARPDVHVVFGGLLLQNPLAEELIDLFPELDSIATGEGEITMWRLVQALEQGRSLEDVPQLVWRAGDRVATNSRVEALVDLNMLFPPDYDDYFRHRLAKAAEVALYPRLCVEFGRGCRWGRCTFCVESTLARSRRGYRSKMPRRIAEEVAGLVRRYRTTDIVVGDADASHRSAAFAELARADQTLRLIAEVAGFVTRTGLERMHEAGLETLQIGVESFSEEILERLNKGVSLMRYVELMKWCRELGLELFYNVIVGTPFETQADIDRAATNMAKLFMFAPPRVSNFVVSYRSVIADHPADYNIRRLLPAAELAALPGEVAGRVGPMISYHGGHDWERSEGEAPDYGEFNRVLENWHKLSELEARMTLRHGVGFLKIELDIGEERRHVFIEDPVEQAIYTCCLRKAQRIDRIGKLLQPVFADVASETVERAILDFEQAGLMFTSRGRALSLAIEQGSGRVPCSVRRESIPAMQSE